MADPITKEEANAIRRDVQASLKQCQFLHDAGALPTDKWHKVLVCLAYELAYLEDFEDAANLLKKVPQSYFQNVQPGHIVEDADYAEVCLALGEKMQHHFMPGKREVN